MIKKGQKIQSEISKETFEVIEKLGEGTQGIVYKVKNKHGEKAVKWYQIKYATQEQKKNIRELITKGPPKGNAGKRFIWPIDIMYDGENKTFGYLMDLYDNKEYYSLGEIWARLKPAPNMKSRCLISYNLANSFRQLHLSGYCYRDLSKNNYVLNKDSDIIIYDNDNVGIAKQSKSSVWGTAEYMAPEIIMGTADPSADSDLYSLAVSLFEIWIWHHPLDGMIAYNINIWDPPAKKKVYGKNPIFIFDPHDKRNCLPKDPDYDTPKKFWDNCPEPLKKMFIRAFTEGIKETKKRVTEGEWEDLFLNLHDSIVRCPKDNAENFWYENIQSIKCWHCGQNIDIPIRLQLKTRSGINHIVLTKETKLRKINFDRHTDENERDVIVGELGQNPNKPKEWGLKNISNNIWKIKTTKGIEKDVSKGKAAIIKLGTVIDFGDSVEGEFVK